MRRMPLNPRARLACPTTNAYRPRRLQVTHSTAQWVRSYVTAGSNDINTGTGSTYDPPFLREPPRNIAVLGGGITGLTTAYTLRRELPDSSSVTLYESSKRFGGWIETTEVPVEGQPGKKIRFERGPRMIKALNESRTRFDDLVLWSIIKDAGIPVAAHANLGSFILGRNGNIISTQETFEMLHNVTDHPIRLCCRIALQYLRFLLPPFAGGFRPPPGDDISVADCLRQMTGSDEMMDRVFSSVVHGITGGNPETTSMREFQFGIYRNIYHKARSKLVGMRPSGDQVPVIPADQELLLYMTSTLGGIMHSLEGKDGSPQHYSLQDGLQSLPDWMSSALATQSNVDLRKDSPVTQVRYDPATEQMMVTARGIDGEPETKSFDAVVSTIPAQRLVEIAPPSSLLSLQHSKSVTIQTVNLWYPQQDLVPPKSVGYLIPRGATKEHNPHRALGVLFDSEALVPARGEPSGTKLFVLSGGHFYDSELSPPPDEATAIQQARETVHKQLGIPLDLEPGAALAKLSRECLPQFEVGHADRMASAHQELLAAFSGRLSVAGPSYKGMGILGGMRAGWDIAMRLAGRVESAHMGDTGLAGFETMQKDGLIPDVFVSHTLVDRFRTSHLTRVFGSPRHEEAPKSARRL